MTNASALDRLSSARRDPSWLPLVVLLIVVAMRFALASPLIDPTSLWSSGRFVYGAQQILQGASLYRDVWSHIPPLIFILNVLGLGIGGGALWGIWLVELLCVLGTVALGYALLRRAFDPTAAFFGMFCFVLGFSLTLVGNQVEEYGLLLQFATVYAFARAEARVRPSAYSYLAGVLIALTFFLRQDLIALGLAVVVYMLAKVVLRRSRFADARLMTVVIGALAVVFVVVVLFGLSGTLDDLWNSAFRFNAVYAEVPLADRVTALMTGVTTLKSAGLPLIAVAAWVVSVAAVAGHQPAKAGTRRLLVVALIALPVAAVLVTVTGEISDNYFEPLLPIVAVLAAYFVFALRGVGDAALVPARVWLAALMIALAVLPLADAVGAARTAFRGPLPNGDIRFLASDYVSQRTNDDSTFLVWGAEPMINARSHRRSPTRFSDQRPLWTPSADAHDDLYAIMLVELIAEPPDYILDTSATNPGLPPIDPQLRARWLSQQTAETLPSTAIPPNLTAVLAFVGQHYRPETRFGSWIIYRRADLPAGSVNP